VPANLGLVTLDAYRVGAHEQLRTYGRILGVPVHTAHDRASLEDLLDLLAAKKMVLIDTAGMAQRDSRTRELLDMLGHRAIQKLLVVNAAQQGETIEDVLIAYRARRPRRDPVEDGRGREARPRARRADPPQPQGRRRRQRPACAGRLAPPVVACAGAPRAAPDAGTAYRMDAGDMNLIFAARSARRAAPRAARLTHDRTT
jgi:flagellar biosynthesis protein FlhF